MSKIVGALLLLIASVVLGVPVKDELMVVLGDDTAVVESMVREARAVVPEHIEDLLKPGVKEAFLHTYGDKENSDGDVQGYRKKTQDKGNDGYRHFDSYHKKDGDKYGYEIHSEYGKSNEASAGDDKNSEKQNEGSEGGDEAESKKSYQVSEEDNEGKKGLRAVEDYDGDSGYYADSGDSESHNTDAASESYIVGEGDESDGYTEGGDGEAEYYEEDHAEGGGESDGEAEGYEYDDSDGYEEEGDDY